MFLDNAHQNKSYTCSVRYGLCGQEISDHGNTTMDSSNRIVLNLVAGQCYRYIVTASNTIHTVMVEGEISTGRFNAILYYKYHGSQ